jgi:hypothetical protein
MTDITLCVWGEAGCVLASTCYRALAEPDEWHQSYFAPEQRGPNCPYYIHEEPTSPKRKP